MMEKQEQIGLSFSLFCSKSVWHTVLTKAIKPFLLQFKAYFNDYAIEFNYTCGENIRLALWCAEKDADDLSKKSDRFFKAFFLDTNFPSRIIKLPVDGIFLPFDFNTVRYGLFKPDEENVLSNEFSDIVIDVLGENEIDDEVIITFTIYLYLALMRVRRAYINSSSPISFLNSVQLNNEELSSEFMNERYTAQESLLLEIYNEVVWGQRSAFKGSLSWLDRWLTFCESKFNQARDSANLDDSISNCINKQLGISNNMSLLINYFLSNLTTGDNESKLGLVHGL